MNMPESVEVVEFEMGGELYALDISAVREIVEMLPITPMPGAPLYIAGIVNLRGEVTHILNLSTLLGLPEKTISKKQKIIFLVPEAGGGTNTGIIVDDVHSVNLVRDGDVESLGTGLLSDDFTFVKGIIKLKEDKKEKKEKGLIIWIDIVKILHNAGKLESGT
jgi:purine-binding chemotaxis protein CheW